MQDVTLNELRIGAHIEALYEDAADKLAAIRARVDALNPARVQCATVNALPALLVEQPQTTGWSLHLDEADIERQDALDNYDRALGLYGHDRDDTESDTADPLISAEMAKSLRTASWGRVDDAYAEAQDAAKPALTSDDRPAASANSAGHLTDPRWVDGRAAYLYAAGMRALDKPGEPKMPGLFDGVVGDAPTASFQAPTPERMWRYVAWACSGQAQPVSITIRGVGSWPTSRFVTQDGPKHRQHAEAALALQLASRPVRRQRKPLAQLNMPATATGRALRQHVAVERTYTPRAVWARDEMWLRCPAQRLYSQTSVPTVTRRPGTDFEVTVQGHVSHPAWMLLRAIQRMAERELLAVRREWVKDRALKGA
jgi:hypothetical protein